MTAISTDFCASTRQPTLHSVESFLRELGRESLRHRAVKHPLLEGFAAGRFPDMAWAIRDFAWHYNGYSAWFPRYLNAVISRLDCPNHRNQLEENLKAEKGHLEDGERQTLGEIGIGPETVANIPRTELLRRFCLATGMSPELLDAPAAAAVQWRTSFLRFLSDASPAAAVGALGLGTESIVKHTYKPIVRALRASSELTRRDYVFFELHCHVDDRHQQDLLDVARRLASTEAGRSDIKQGMTVALELRKSFWDHLYRRAVRGPQLASA